MLAMTRFAQGLAFAVALLVAGCATLPPPGPRTDTTALRDTGSTALGRAVAARVAEHQPKSGIHPLPLPADAFAARVLLAGAAERSLDVQYYLWHGDETGTLLFEAMLRAADRGVRVRMLIDDINTAGLDPLIAALDAHPNMEVRLYNPLVYRSARLANFAVDFARVNRRMHNKAFIADNQVAVVGGRNVANEYMGAGDEIVFADLDVLAVGPVVAQVSKEFDLYWNSASAYPAQALLGVKPDSALLETQFAQVRADPKSIAYVAYLRDASLVKALLAGRLELEWTDAIVVHDDPAKTLDTTGRTDVLLLPQLLETIGPPKKSFDLVSPYFVPGDKAAAALVALARQGVKVRVLTNSLASTDVVAVHAGYARHRVELLKAGVVLYEIKTTAAADDPRDKAVFGLSSSSSLHAKTFAIDGARVFVGSFNFDQRSAHLNTEMGVIIDSPVLAHRIATAFDTVVPRVAYQVTLSPEGTLQWIDRTSDGERRFDVEPDTTASRRSLVELLSLLPIEWLL